MTTTDPANQPTSSSGWLAYAAPSTASDRQPSTPGQARKRLADAKRHLFAHIIASAYLLDEPFTNAPDQSPWSRMKHAMAGLDAAIAALDAAPATYSLPPEPDCLLWDCYGHRWDRHAAAMRWERADQRDDPYWRGWAWQRLLGEYGPLSPAPPAGTEGDHAE